jgi:hypothetical protein
MRAYTLLILFSFFQVLFCALEGLSLSKLHEVYVKSLPYMKAFKPESFNIPSTFRFKNLKFNYADLTNNSTNFTFDEFNVLHVKFNLKAKMTGQYKTGTFFKSEGLYDFTANFTNITYEQLFNVITTKQNDGKYVFKYKKIGSSELSFKSHLNFTSTFRNKEFYTSMASSSIKNLNYTEFSSHLSKLQTLVLDNVANELLK